MSDRLCIHNPKSKYLQPSEQVRLSADDMLSCCTECGMGCNGGFPTAAWQFWRDEGLVTGGLYGTKGVCRAYEIPPCEHHVKGDRPECNADAKTPACVHKCQSDYKIPYNKDKHYGKR